MLDRLFRTLRWLPARRLLDRRFYLAKYPDLTAAGVNPWRHYVEFGAAEGRKPHPLFDPTYYVRRNPAAAGAAPLLHFLHSGGRARMSPHPLFDCEAYVAANPQARDQNALQYFLDHRHRSSPATEGSQFGCAS